MTIFDHFWTILDQTPKNPQKPRFLDNRTPPHPISSRVTPKSARPNDRILREASGTPKIEIFEVF